MDHQVRLFELRKDAKATDAPVPVSGFAVTAETLEDARRIAVARLATGIPTAVELMQLDAAIERAVFQRHIDPLRKRGRRGQSGNRGDQPHQRVLTHDSKLLR